jgi:hypothetical protein
MELMGFPRAVSQPDGFEFDMFKIIQTTVSGYFRVEALAAKLLAPLIHGAVIDDIVAGRDPTTPFARD